MAIRKRYLAYGLLALGLVTAGNAAPADAQPLCEHRSEAHALQHNKSVEADSRWHVLHGDLPTCGVGDKGSNDRHDGGDDHRVVPRRDHPGFHCTWHGCG